MAVIICKPIATSFKLFVWPIECESIATIIKRLPVQLNGPERMLGI